VLFEFLNEPALKRPPTTHDECIEPVPTTRREHCRCGYLHQSKKADREHVLASKAWPPTSVLKADVWNVLPSGVVLPSRANRDGEPYWTDRVPVPSKAVPSNQTVCRRDLASSRRRRSLHSAAVGWPNFNRIVRANTCNLKALCGSALWLMLLASTFRFRFAGIEISSSYDSADNSSPEGGTLKRVL